MVDLAKELLRRGADAHPPVDKYGRNLLHVAAKGGSAELVTLLIADHGFEPDSEVAFLPSARSGETALVTAAREGHAAGERRRPSASAKRSGQSS